MKRFHLFSALTLGLLAGCASDGGPSHDRPFPLGQVTDAHWETQQTNAEAADFVFFEHEFAKDSAQLAPSAKRHLESVALRLPHVPFPVVIEQTPLDKNPALDAARRRTIVESLARMGLPNVEPRVLVANAFPAGRTSIEAEQTYYMGILSGGMGGQGGGMGGGMGGGGFQ
jgi:hypothetical protein